MKPITQLIYAAALLCCMAGCTKKDPLPDATQQGLNTFGCNIDGVAWIPTGTSGPGGTKPVSAGLRQDGTFRIYAGSPEYLLVMNVPNVTTNKTGEYNLGNLTDNFGNFFTKATNIDYLTDKSNLGKVVITKMDTTKRIVSGTFYFKAKDVKSDKVIDISNGRFDVSY